MKKVFIGQNIAEVTAKVNILLTTAVRGSFFE